VVLHGLGQTTRAEVLWSRAIAAVPEQAESLYCLAVSRLENAAAAGGGRPGTPDLDRARELLARVRQIDPGLGEAWIASALVEALAGDCAAAGDLKTDSERVAAATPRRYPAGIGDGSGLSASIGRRRLIPLAPALLHAFESGACGDGFASGRHRADS
jgi:hypothetical protein